ncbi:restriction endonuclease subunit S [Aerococcaceae bacterium 50-4]
MTKNNEKKVPKLRFKGFTDDWEQRKFEKIANRINKTSTSIELPKVEFEDIVAGEGRLNKDLSQKLDNRKGIEFQPSDVLYGKLRPYLKNWLFSDFFGIALGDFWVLRANDLTPSFLYTLIQSVNFQRVANDTSGTKMPRSDWKKVSSTKFYIPLNINEQKKIGDLISQLDQTLTLHQRKVEQLEQLKQALLQQMFPGKDEVVPKLRFANFQDDWEQSMLDDVVDTQIKGKAQAEKLNTGEVEYLDTARLNGGEPILTDGIPNVEKDDILILWDGSKAGTVYTGFEGTLGSTLKAYKTSANSWFVFQFLKKHQEKIYYNYRTPNIPHVQKDFLEVFQIVIPSREEQNKIGKLLTIFDKSILFHQLKLNNLKLIKESLLHNLFI